MSALSSWDVVRERCGRIWNVVLRPCERSSKLIDLDSRLDDKLRSEYERLEAERPPAWLLDFDPKLKRSRGRRFSGIAGIAGLAVIAAGIATFGIELGSHSRPAPPATHTSLAATPTV